MMGDPVVMRGWNADGLPNDQVSGENGIIATAAERYALCIDPQNQANMWIKNMYEEDDQLVLLKFGAENFFTEITAAVSNGRPCLVEDLEEYIDPAINPILMKRLIRTDSGTM